MVTEGRGKTRASRSCLHSILLLRSSQSACVCVQAGRRRGWRAEGHAHLRQREAGRGPCAPAAEGGGARAEAAGLVLPPAASGEHLLERQHRVHQAQRRALAGALAGALAAA